MNATIKTTETMIARTATEPRLPMLKIPFIPSGINFAISIVIFTAPKSILIAKYARLVTPIPKIAPTTIAMPWLLVKVQKNNKIASIAQNNAKRKAKALFDRKSL